MPDPTPANTSRSGPRFHSGSSFILSLKRFDQRRGWRVTLLDLRSGERFEFDSLEAAWFFLGEHEPRLGLK